MSALLRVVIADDHPLYRDGLRIVLSSSEVAEVVGEASNGTQAVALAAELVPDVVVMDLRMPEINGIDATRQIAGRHSETAVLVLTMFEDDDSVFAAMRAGARGYVLKGADKADIIRAVQAVAGGELIFGPGIADRVMRYFASAREGGQLSPFPHLTDREREVLEVIAEGQSNQVIARRLVLSPKTVRNHVSNIFAKLQVADRAQAIVRAREAGLGDRKRPPQP
jgi:DNA-binding NarL/FixJ family response regulator